jgi:hypothetical protein
MDGRFLDEVTEELPRQAGTPSHSDENTSWNRFRPSGGCASLTRPIEGRPVLKE